MARDPKSIEFLGAKSDTVKNLKEIRESLNRSLEEGMLDLGDAHYNELLALLDEAALAGCWDELLEVISKAKTLETDIAVWLARHGRTSISLPWPKGVVK